MPKQKSREREQFWRQTIRQQRTSGLSVAKFCERAGVSAVSFYAWKRRLREASGAIARPGRRNSLVPVRVVVDPPNFTAAAEVALPGGIALRIPPGYDGVTLGVVLEALGQLIDRGA